MSGLASGKEVQVLIALVLENESERRLARDEGLEGFDVALEDRVLSAHVFAAVPVVFDQDVVAARCIRPGENQVGLFAYHRQKERACALLKRVKDALQRAP